MTARTRIPVHLGSLALIMLSTACAAPAPAADAGHRIASVADDGTASTPIRWTPSAWSTDQYESSPTFSPDGREAYLMRADARFRGYRLLWSRCVAGHWTVPEDVPFAAPAPILEGDPALSPDGRRLYYISTRHAHPGDDFDIWVVERGTDGAWGQPRRLPEPVNSSGAELLPRPGPGGMLYFGSSRAGGYGQSDIYMAEPLTSDGGGERWTVRNVGPPVSTAANEYEADVSRDGRTLVVVADRGDRSHLYRFVRQGERWVEVGRTPGRPDVFQVGPLLSPRADRLLFAQADGERSGELFVVDLAPDADRSWPPRCAAS